ncbi:natural resistance-associated macrophage protein-domain-containing protein [Umbelopsis sp. PMI_123]|nr:natural resistance-associated macrophage protein-domain-containing protein [Umbelopsis sp. PMI_123]
MEELEPVSSESRFLNDTELKAEIDTGNVSEQWFSFKKLWTYAGPAYLDPGNLESDLQAGAIAGYSLLWLLFWAHVTGLLFQILSARLGTVTGKHLAQLIRCHYSRRVSIVIYCFTQCAIIGADIMEIVGSAIALRIILNIPLWSGVLLTATDTVTFSLVQYYGMRKLEALFMVLIALMAICFWIEMLMSRPEIASIFEGIALPIIPENSVVQAVGMLGAVVMPHNMFLHSALVQSRDLGKNPTIRKLKEANFYFAIESGLALLVSFLINLAIVVCFGQVFYDENAGSDVAALPGLYDAGDVLNKTLGSGARYLWAAGLLAAGQSSTTTGMMAGGFALEGFFRPIFKKAWHRVAITRAVSLVPSMLVSIFAVQHFDTMGELLNVLQSLCLPTALIPILKLSSSTRVMSADFQISNTLYTICWLLAAIVIGFDIFLFSTYLHAIPSVWVAVILGISYLVS